MIGWNSFHATVNGIVAPATSSTGILVDLVVLIIVRVSSATSTVGALATAVLAVIVAQVVIAVAAQEVAIVVADVAVADRGHSVCRTMNYLCTDLRHIDAVDATYILDYHHGLLV